MALIEITEHGDSTYKFFLFQLDVGTLVVGASPTAVGQRVFLPRPTFGEAMFTLNTAVGQANMPLVVHP